ncbi:hypothetical protein [Flavobacterium psychrotolerans]|uniref:Porin n=1 Tax=Flavobacterium psychrotolerans TaxID=2169410 RepID=A0A2U1JQJ8_9FLAO|nr:hypothetical protein [Flavobacterium psychrotolerans]PWA07456.1 hypothetical protein DB895_01705 [Flavobacterium psychrotolerans]
MKTFIKISLIITAFCLSGNMKAQTTFGHIQNQIPRDQRGINQFDVKKDSVAFKGLSIDLGAAFALQFQGLNSFNDQKDLPATIVGYKLNNLSNNLNLPTANMTLGAQLFDGVRVNLDLYLAARHHNETWVKGGYLQIDKLDFIRKDFLADVMKYATIKIGQMENNYGDAHFRRSDNGNALANPFIESNIMDSFTTEPGIEVYYNRSGWVSMLGITNSKLNQNVGEYIAKSVTVAAPNPNTTVSPTILAKLGYDKQIDKDLRVRLTASLYHCANTSGNLYSSDRAGSHYYYVMSHAAYANGAAPVTNNMTTDLAANPTTGRFNPGFGNWSTNIMINPFVKYQGLEFFGTLEFASGGDKAGVDDKRTVNQYTGDVVYRFGSNEKFYVGGRYGTVSGKLANADTKAVTVNRLETSLGWFMTKNIVSKLAYVNQEYKDYAQFTGTTPNDLYGGSFKGLMFEAVITF